MSIAHLIQRAFVTTTLVGISSTALAGFVVTIEAPGVVETTATFTPSGENGTDIKGVETFNSRPIQNNQTFQSNFGGAAHGITGDYKGVNVIAANQYGGAGGSPNQYAVAGLQNAVKSYSIEFNKDLTYFGYWLSALDAGNRVQFYLNGTNVFTFTPANVLALVGASGPYYGKPLDPNQGQNQHEPYVFLNFFGEGGAAFDEIVFSQVEPVTAGYESDNHTVGIWEKKSGTPVPPSEIPLPSTLLLALSGLIAVSLTRRSQA
ncbi:MAG: hypothetical protein KF720_04735 [Rubrivivax sp.]|nr:hypothetical protein [Rubrivivax sp.]